jgi:hypothetical protein
MLTAKVKNCLATKTGTQEHNRKCTSFAVLIVVK